MDDVLPLIALGVTFLAVYAWVAALLGPIPLLILLILPSKLPFEQTPGS
ncbi:MAG: hypothetical protein WAU90_08670 [Methyloceanibacter sp.]